MKPQLAIDGDRTPGRFETTRWSLVLSCANSGSTKETARQALGELCQVYWRPIFVFICRRGYSVVDAQDLTQDFFLMVLEGNLLALADPCRGRFRTLLLRALQNFLIDKHDRGKTKKRGGGIDFVRWDDWMAETPSQLSIPSGTLTDWPPEKIFDLRWATTVVEQALRLLAEECESRGRRRMFTVLSRYLTTERADISYASLSASLGIPANSVKRLLHHLRERYRDILRHEVAQTVETAAEVDEEIRYLCAALATSAS